MLVPSVHWDVEAHAELTGHELGPQANTKLLRKAAMAYAELHLIGKSFTNEHTGNVVYVGKGGIKHTLSHSGDELLKSIPAIAQLISKGRLAKVETDKKGDRNVLSVEKYAANLQIGVKRFNVILTAKVHQNGRRYYDHGFISAIKRA